MITEAVVSIRKPKNVISRSPHLSVVSSIQTYRSGETLAEKFSTASNMRREKRRVISGITALNLIQEKKFDEAQVYARSFLELRNFSVEDLAQNLSCGFLPNRLESKQIAEKLIDVSVLLSHDPASIEKSELEEHRKKLVGLLNVLSDKRRI